MNKLIELNNEVQARYAKAYQSAGTSYDNDTLNTCARIESFISSERLYYDNTFKVRDYSIDPIVRMMRGIFGKAKFVYSCFTEELKVLNIGNHSSRTERRKKLLKDVENGNYNLRDIQDLIGVVINKNASEYIFHKYNLKELMEFKIFSIIKSTSYVGELDLTASITGGYVRNILMNTFDPKTDIDIVLTCELRLLSELFTELSKEYRRTGDSSGYNNEFIISEQLVEFSGVTLTPEEKSFIINNKIHFISKGSYQKSEMQFKVNKFFDKKRESISHLDIDKFDLTINCGYISIENGYLYASPIVLYDAQNKIIRNLSEISSSSRINISLVIRAIRFMYKYEASISKDTYNKLMGYTAMINKVKVIEIELVHNSIRGSLNESEDVKNKIFKTLQDIDFFETRNFGTMEDYYKYLQALLPKFKEAKRRNTLAAYCINGSNTDDY